LQQKQNENPLNVQMYTAKNPLHLNFIDVSYKTRHVQWPSHIRDIENGGVHRLRPRRSCTRGFESHLECKCMWTAFITSDHDTNRHNPRHRAQNMD